MSQRDDIDISDSLISKITDKVLPEIKEFRDRRLEAIYPIVYMDAMVFKIKNESGVYSHRALHFAIGINLEGKKELMGMWLAKNEGAKFWLSIVTELKNRGVEDILIASVDGLKGFSEAINSVFPQSIVQRCIIDQIRYSMKYVGSKYQKEFMNDLKLVYKAQTKGAAEDALLELENKWGEKYPMVINSWSNNWDELSAYFHFSEPIRRIIYTTNTVEGFNRQIRKITKTKGGFNSDDSLYKLVFLAYRDIAKKWDKSISNWAEIISQFSIHFEKRLQGYIR
jgi:putative transposase